MEFNEIIKQIKMIKKDYPSYWGNALAGEVGELCNLIKKYERDDFLEMTLHGSKMGEELAGVFIYLVCIARFFEIDLETVINREIYTVNQRDYLKDVE